MATTKLGNTKSSSRAINYAEKRAEVKSGHNCDINYAKSNFKQLRELYSKNDGIQAHTIIQSFKPGEVTPEKANEIGLELAKEVANGHQVAVYTHTDTEHTHNHIIINSVNMENGKKYQSNAEQRHLVKDKNDEICRNHDLSVVTEKNASVRYTLTEQHLLEKNQISWKDEMREAIEFARDNSINFDDLKSRLHDDYGIETKLRGKTLSFKHPERERFVRASKLGADYEKEGLENVIARQTGREQEDERVISRNEGTQRTDEKLYQSSYERRNGERSYDSQPIKSNPVEIGQSHEQHAINLEHARQNVERKRREFASDFDKWTRGNRQEQQQDGQSSTRDENLERTRTESNKQRDQHEHDRSEKQPQQRSQRSKERDEGLSR